MEPATLALIGVSLGSTATLVTTLVSQAWSAAAARRLATEQDQRRALAEAAKDDRQHRREDETAGRALRARQKEELRNAHEELLASLEEARR